MNATISPENTMKSLRSHPLLPPLALCLALSFAGTSAPSHAAVDAPTPALDWSQAAPRPAGSPMADNLPALNRAVVSPVQPSVDNKPAARTATKRTVRSGAIKASKGLFALEDRAIIIVGGRNTTAGEVKRALQRELVAKAGAPKIVNGGARKLDLAAQVGAGPKPIPLGGPIGAYLKPTATTATPSASQVAQTVRPGVTQSIAGNKQVVSLASLRCPDKGMPKISEVSAKLKAGGKATVSGWSMRLSGGGLWFTANSSGGSYSNITVQADETGLRADALGATTFVSVSLQVSTGNALWLLGGNSLRFQDITLVSNAYPSVLAISRIQAAMRFLRRYVISQFPRH